MAYTSHQSISSQAHSYENNPVEIKNVLKQHGGCQVFSAIVKLLNLPASFGSDATASAFASAFQGGRRTFCKVPLFSLLDFAKNSKLASSN